MTNEWRDWKKLHDTDQETIAALREQIDKLLLTAVPRDLHSRLTHDLQEQLRQVEGEREAVKRRAR